MASVATARSKSEVDSVIASVFGEAAVATDAAAVAPRNRFFAIPGNGAVRWLVPQESAIGLAVLRGWTPYTPASRLKWQLLLAAYRSGMLSQLPGVVALGIAAGQIPFPPLVSGFETCVPVVYVGTPGIGRKAVVSLVEPGGKIRGVLKTPLSHGARAKIVAEARALRKLEALPGIAPKLLHCDEQLAIAVQEYCEGHAAPAAFSASYLEWLAALAVPGATIRMNDYADGLVQRTAQCHALTEAMRSAIVRALRVVHGVEHVPACRVHGDFAPWNLRLDRNGTISCAVDWEDFQPSGLPLFDYLHYNFMQAYLFKRTILWPKLLAGCQPYARRLGLTQPQVQALLLAYLAESLLTRTDEGSTGHAEWLVGMLMAATRKEDQVI
jgi:hypothetical protein